MILAAPALLRAPHARAAEGLHATVIRVRSHAVLTRCVRKNSVSFAMLSRRSDLLQPQKFATVAPAGHPAAVNGLLAEWINSSTPRPTTAAGPLIPCFSPPACQVRQLSALLVGELGRIALNDATGLGG
jgi:hypothetical protein